MKQNGQKQKTMPTYNELVKKYNNLVKRHNTMCTLLVEFDWEKNKKEDIKTFVTSLIYNIEFEMRRKQGE